MQTVSNKFREQAYSGEALYLCNLSINNIAIPTEQIASIKIDSPIIDTSTETFYIGSFISQSITIKFKNLDGLDIQSGYEVSLEIGQNIYDEETQQTVQENVPIGIYLIDELAENYQETCEITCMDFAIKFKPNIDYSPCFTNGTATTNKIINYICDQFGVEIETDINQLPNGDVVVGTYDSSISGKQWLSYLAEIKGCNLKMSRNGKLLFLPFKKTTPDVTINALESAEWELGEKFEISQVVYFDAVRNFTFGNATENTLFIRQDNPFVTDANVIKNIYNTLFDFEEKEVEGQDIEINDGNSEIPAKITLYGNTYQHTTSGKNLLDISDVGTTGMIKNNGDGSITLNGTGGGGVSFTLTKPFVLKANTTYTLSVSETYNASSATFILRNGNTNVMQVRYSVGYVTYTPTEDVTINTIRIFLAAATFNNYTFYPQLEIGSEATEFEPYTNGASPNPDYPQYIQVVTGLNTININEDEYEVNLGKNLFDDTIVQGVVGNTGVNNVPNRIRNTKFINVNSGQTYSLSFETTNGINQYNISYFTNASFPRTSETGWINTSFTIPSGINYIMITFSKSSGTNIIPTDISNVQLEKGSQVTSYSPYKTPIELCKINDNQDYIYKDNNKWFLHKEIGKIILDGNEQWGINGTRFSLTLTGYGNGAKPILCTHFIPTDDWEYHNTQNYTIIVFKNEQWANARLSINDSDFSTINDFKNWLSTNNVIVYFPLAKPTNTEITNQTLINELNALENITLLNGHNTISCANEFKPYLKLNYTIKNNFKIWSLKTKNYGDISLDAWDLIQFNLGYDENNNLISYQTLNNNMITYEMNIVSEINAQIPNKQKEVTTNVVGGDEATRIRMIKTLLDYVNAQVTLQAEEQKVLTNRLTQLILDVNSIQSIFQITGGNNLIKNSQFLLTDATWNFLDLTARKTKYDNKQVKYDNKQVIYEPADSSLKYHTDLGEGYNGNMIGLTVSPSEVKLRNIVIETKQDNITDLKLNNIYTLNYSYKQDANTTTRIQLIEKISGNCAIDINTQNPIDITYNETTTNITENSFQFMAEDTSYIFKITTSTTSGTDGYFYLYDLMLNSGDKKTWEPAVSEIYSTTLQMSQQGLKVISTGSKTITMLEAEGLQIKQWISGKIGEVITKFTNEGLVTGVAETKEVHTGNYVMTEVTINNKEHHIEYFKR